MDRRRPTAAIPWERLRAVLFDLDGTLVESDNRWASLLAQRLAPLRRLVPGFDADAWGRRLVMALETPSNYAIAALERLGLGPRFLGLADRVRRSKGLATRDHAELVEGTEEILALLAERYRLAVVTMRARPEAEAFLQRADLRRWFGAVVTRQDVWRLKPHPQPVHRAAELLGVPPEACLMVGDTTMDVRAALRAGAWAVAVLSGFGERDELQRAGAHLVLDSVADLIPLARRALAAQSETAPSKAERRR